MDSGLSTICFPRQLIDDLKWLLAGIVTSTVVYSFNFIIAIISFRASLRRRRRDDSKKQPTALCTYIVGIFGLGTVAVVHSNLAIIEFGRIIVSGVPGGPWSLCNLPQFSTLAHIYKSENLYNLVVSPSLPVTIWAADGILVGISRQSGKKHYNTLTKTHWTLLDMSIFCTLPSSQPSQTNIHAFGTRYVCHFAVRYVSIRTAPAILTHSWQ